MNFSLQTNKSLYAIEQEYKQFQTDKDEIVNLIKQKDHTLRKLI